MGRPWAGVGLAAAAFAAMSWRSEGGCLAPELLYGTTSWKGKYEHICCDVPQTYAEHAGFYAEPGIRFFDRLLEMETAVRAGSPATSQVVAEKAGVAALDGVHIRKSSGGDAYEWVFYDSQCGLPLFVAPRGRTFQEWRVESENHGWPSFRPEEVVADSLILRAHDEVVSACPQPTHLGHLFKDSKGGRYCIDLLCMAGQNSNATPASASLVTGGAVRSAASASRFFQPLALLAALRLLQG